MRLDGLAGQYETLTASNTLADDDGLGAIRYWWEVAAGGGWAAIEGGEGDAYTLTQAEVGKSVRVVATYTDGIGRQEVVVSAASAPIANVNDAPTGAVSLAGLAAQNQTLRAANTLVDADGIGVPVYQWQVAGGDGVWSDITGATAAAFTLTQAEVGKAVRVLARYVDACGTPESVGSSATTPVENVNDAPTGVVSVAGDAVQGALLVAGETLADADGLGPVAYQWQSLAAGEDWADISGATTNTLTPAMAEVGKRLRVLARYTDGGGTDECVASAVTLPVKALFSGSAAADVLAGSAGADWLVGGGGNDTYVVNHPDDVVVEDASGGVDRVLASVSMTLAANVENLSLTGSAAIDGSGNELANVITGNAAANTLSGLGGDDTLSGGAAGDRLFGGEGNDRLSGGGGNDTLDGGAGADTLIGGFGNDSYIVSGGDTLIEEDRDGVDTVYSGINWTLGSHFERLTLTGEAAVDATGNEQDNVLTGNCADNVLDGGKGADTMIGGAGNDRYVVEDRDDVVVEVGDGGIDRIVADRDMALPDNVEVLMLGGKGALHGSGNALDNLLCGNAGNNVLDGGAGRDVLQGAGGNDTLSDRSGASLLSAGAGNDTLIGGADACLFIGGAGNDDLSTGAGDDVICFNAGDGKDRMRLGGGRDTLSLGAGIAVDDLCFARSGKDLLLTIGKEDRISIDDWYAAKPARSMLTLQLLVQAMASFDAPGIEPGITPGIEPASRRPVETFDLAGLASDFDAARAADPHLKSWSLDQRLSAHRLAGSETAAFGGDLAFQYGKSGALTGVGLAAAQGVIGETGFGSQMQTLHPLADLQGGAFRLL